MNLTLEETKEFFRKFYGNEVDEGWNPFSDYNPLLESLGYKILLKIDESDYQGDSFVLFQDDAGCYGFLTFGWGSCSGCDALQACSNTLELWELRQHLLDSIHWKDNKKEMLEYFLNTDWEGKWCGTSQEFKEFLQKATTLLFKENEL